MKEIKKLLRERRKSEITNKIKKLERFREDEEVLNYLEDMSHRDGHSYFDVFVSYYDKLYQAYQIVYIACNKISAIKELSRKLIKEL